MQHSSDGTRKWMLRADASQAFEMVFIPENERGTLCISSQVGCLLDCSFCSTAQQGFNRNLTTAEIVGQVWLAKKELGFEAGGDRIVTNVVLMGMGEPLANFRNVVPAVRILMDDYGLRPVAAPGDAVDFRAGAADLQACRGDATWRSRCRLHAPDDELRNELVPINRKHPIKELLDGVLALHRRAERPQRDVRVRHVGGRERLPGTGARARGLLKGHPAKVNLIPFNPFPGTRYKRSSQETIHKFRDD